MDKPVEYEQTDKRWAAIPYTITGSKNQTIGVSGCGPSSAAMVVATLRDKKITPKEAAAWSVQHGYRTRNDGTAWGFFPAYLKNYNIPCAQTGDTDEIIAALKQGLMVICAMGKGLWTSGGHILLAYGLAENGSKVLINDPNSEAVYRELGDIYKFKGQIAQGWIIKEEWNMPEIKEIEIQHRELGVVKMKAVNVNGENYVRLRDVEKIAAIDIGWDGERPTVQHDYD